MPTVVQFRRGTTAQNDNFIGAAGEISYDNQSNTIRVHDGSTSGGFESVTTASAQTISNKTLDSANISGALFASDSDVVDIGTDGARFRGAYIGTLYTKDGIVKAQPAGVSVTSGSATIVASYVTGGASTAIEFNISAYNDSSSETQISKILTAFDGTNIASTEYGIVHTGDSDLGSLAVTNNSGTIEVKFTRNPATTILVKAHQTIIT
jgi:hypothetical protein